MEAKRSEILTYIKENPGNSSKEIFEGISFEVGYATVKRILI